MATKLQKPLNILSILAQIDDPRVERTKKHRLLDILFIGLVATMCGCKPAAAGRAGAPGLLGRCGAVCESQEGMVQAIDPPLGRHSFA